MLHNVLENTNKLNRINKSTAYAMARNTQTTNWFMGCKKEQLHRFESKISK